MDKNAQHRGIRRVVSTHLPTVFGVFNLIGFERAGFDRANMAKREHETALVMMLGDLQDRYLCFAFIRSASPAKCLDLCAAIAEASWNWRCPPLPNKDSSSHLLTPGGRGSGLSGEAKGYALQDQGLDTIEANEALGFDADCRDSVWRGCPP